MIECVFEWLARHGVTDTVLSLAISRSSSPRLPSNVIAGVRVNYAVEPEPLDTAGAIRFAATQFGFDETFLVVNGDVLTDLNITTLRAFHHDHGGEATIALHPSTTPRDSASCRRRRTSGHRIRREATARRGADEQRQRRDLYLRAACAGSHRGRGPGECRA